MEDKELIKLLYEKIDLLEKFIVEAGNLIESNDWHATDKEMKPFEILNDKLEEIDIKLINHL